MNWTPADRATLRRMSAAGYSDGEIGQRLSRTKAAVQGERTRLGIRPGLSPGMRAVLARLTLRRTLARAAG